MSARAHPAAVNGPHEVASSSPYAHGCDTNIEQQGFGERITDAEAEPTLTVDPRDERRLVAAWMQDLYRGYVAAWSTNGGTKWHTSIVPGISRCSGDPYELAADPWLSTGPEGTTYLAGISLDINDAPRPSGPPFLPFRERLQVNRSTNGGRTWSAPAVIVGGEGRLHDKPSITADPGRAGHAYVVWTEYLTPLGPPPEGISFSRTTDGGQTWSPPMHLNFPTPPGTNPQGALIDVLPDGSLLALTTVRAQNGSSQPHRVYAMRSSDQGATWTPPTLVTEFPATDGRHSTPFSDPETGKNVDAPEWAISSAVTPAGTVYVTWRHRTSPDAAEIRVTESSDGGRTWAAPITVASSGSEMFLPVVAVASDGTVGVTYYDERRDLLGKDGYTADFWFAHSHDGGATWQERHVAGPVDLRTALLRKIPVRGLFLGDYHGLVPLRGGFGSAFAAAQPAARVGGSDVFFARLRTSPSGGSGE
ncbi:MAG: glycoside hydrolase [Chloroflexota bacterium]|nr:glycoside hydrolase [Chloroflexota bacterium]